MDIIVIVIVTVVIVIVIVTVVIVTGATWFTLNATHLPKVKGGRGGRNAAIGENSQLI